MNVETLTVAEIAELSLAAVEVLEQYKIDYCSGAERSLEQVCREQGLDVDVVVEALSRAAVEQPPARDWTTAPLRELIQHLIFDDHARLRAQLPVLEKRIKQVVATYGAQHPTMVHLVDVFHSLATELEAHLNGEERELFPAIERYLQAIENGQPLRGSPLAAFGGPLHLMEQEHESTAAALRLLREFCSERNTPRNVCRCYRALVEGLSEFEDHLARHMYVENTVLYPRAAALKPNRATAARL